MEVHDIGFGDIEVTPGVLDPADIWEVKDKWLEGERISLKEWEAMDDETRAAIIDVVDRSMERMRDREDIWVPASMHVEQGSYIDIKFRLLFSDIEKEKAAKVEITERKIREASAELAKTVEEASSRKSE